MLDALLFVLFVSAFFGFGVFLGCKIRGSNSKSVALNPCPYSDGNSCEQYRLQGQRCQNCPLPNS